MEIPNRARQPWLIVQFALGSTFVRSLNFINFQFISDKRAPANVYSVEGREISSQAIGHLH